PERRQVPLAEEERAHRPYLAEDAVLERRRVEVVDAGRAAGSGSPPDDALDHARVPLPEDDELLLERDDRVDDLARPREQRKLAVALDEGERRGDLFLRARHLRVMVGIFVEERRDRLRVAGLPGDGALNGCTIQPFAHRLEERRLVREAHLHAVKRARRRAGRIAQRLEVAPLPASERDAFGVRQAEQNLDLAQLRRLEAARRAELVAE